MKIETSDFDDKAERFWKSEAHLENCTGKKQTTNNQSCSTFSIVLGKVEQCELARSSEQERRVDAMALIADEGRDKLR